MAACCWLTSALAHGAPCVQDLSPSRSYEVALWTTSNGMPQGTVNDLLQTGDGALWIATFGGLLLFDGAEFRTFDLDTLPKLPSIRVTSLVADGPNGIWVGTQSGNVLRMRDGVVIGSADSGTLRGEIVQLVVDAQESLWMRTSSGRLLRWRDGADVEVIGPGSNGSYEGLARDTTGGVAVGVGRRLRLFDGEGRETGDFEAPSPVEAVAVRDPGTYWLGLSDGLAVCRDGRVERVAIEPPLHSRVVAILPENDGSLWLGTHEGPRHAVPSTAGGPWVLDPPLVGLPERFMVRALQRDREGNLWIGSFGQGLARITPHRVDRVSSTTAESIVTAVVSDGGDGALVALSCRGLTRVDGRTMSSSSVELPPGAKPETCVIALARGPDGQEWAATGSTVLRREGTEWREVITTDGVVNPHCAMTVAADGVAWVATTTGEVVAVDRAGHILRTVLLPQRPVTLLAAPDGSMWIGGSSMLWHVRGDEVRTYDQGDGLSRGDVRDLLLDDDGAIWIATYGGGLSRLRDGRIQRVSRENGLPDNSLSCVLDDHMGRLWISSNRGLIVIAKAQLRAFFDGDSKELDFVLLGPRTGMPEANFGIPSGFRDEQGRLWFGTIAGVVRIDPAEFPSNRTPPTVRVRAAFAEDEPLVFTDAIDVPAGTRRLVVHFTAYGQTNPDEIRYRSRLVGFDDHWVDSGAQPQVSFTALPPGNYTFQVLARNEEGVWSDRPLSLPLTIEPMWWQTATFRILAVLAAGGLALGLHRLRVEVIRRSSRRLIEATEGRARAELRESRLREELAHVARVATAGELATSLAHEVNQPLAAIVANAQAGRRLLVAPDADHAEVRTILDEIAQQGRRASEVIRRLREFLSKHEEERTECDVNVLLRDTLPLLRRELEEHRVTLDLDLDDRVPGVTIDSVQIQQVFVNLLKNACEAMSTAVGDRRILVRTATRDDGVRVTVRDTGPGIAAAVRERLFQPYVTTKPTGMGLGLAICRTIVEAHAGNLSHVANEAGGAEFRVDLPGHPPRNADRAGEREDGKSPARPNPLAAAETTLEDSSGPDSDSPTPDGKVTS